MIEFLDMINNKCRMLLSRLTEDRATKLDYLNASISSRLSSSDERLNHLDSDVSASKGRSRSVEFTQSGIFTVPDGVYLVWISLVGAGGGGGGGAGGTTTTYHEYTGGGGGGGAGESIFRFPLCVSPGDVIDVYIGAGGTPGLGGSAGANDGSSGAYGGTTYIKLNGQIVIGALGGAPGLGGKHADNGGGLGGGSRYYNDNILNIPGAEGGYGGSWDSAPTNASSGRGMFWPFGPSSVGQYPTRAGGGGGSSPFGKGGDGGDGASGDDFHEATAGADGSGPGAGGGGGGAGTCGNYDAVYLTGKPGGKGSDGKALIEWIGA